MKDLEVKSANPAGGKVAQLKLIRTLDIGAALVGGFFSLPVLVILMVWIRLDSRGPAIFRQQRVGRNRQTFTCYKLRTMAMETPSAGSHEVSSTFVTRLGHTLRRFKLDELPQLWNVLCGHMSLVGPRPCLPSQVELIAARQALGVYAVRPGVTGPSQVQGLDMSTPQALAAEDARWASSPAVTEYFRLVILTCLGRGRGDAVRS